jgi:hypothetical protein
MGWEDHQAVVIAHDDKAYHHAHVVLNAVHPETGRKLDDGLERRRAQAWALAYEQERGQDFCPERSRPAPEREAGETRPAWMDIKEYAARAIDAERRGATPDLSYMGRQDNRRVLERREWEILKEFQRNERIAFFENGRTIYRELNRTIYREVREEFRNEWASYYAAMREGLEPDALKEMRAGLIERQNEVLEQRREDATAEKRAERDHQYRALLDTQKEERGELIDRQELGLRSPHLLDRAYPHDVRDAGLLPDRLLGLDETLDRFGVMRGRSEHAAEQELAPRASAIDDPLASSSQGKSEGAPSRDIGLGLAGGVLGALGALGDSLLGGRSKPPPKSPQLKRFGVQRGQPPPGDANERAARELRQEYEDWHAWRQWHHYEKER